MTITLRSPYSGVTLLAMTKPNPLRRLSAPLTAALAIAGVTTACEDPAAFIRANYRPERALPAAATKNISDEKLAAIRECESHGNYTVVSPTGKYRGAYQFSQRTWNNVARSILPEYVGVDPADAPWYIQDAMARALYIMTGPGSWPVCGYR